MFSKKDDSTKPIIKTTLKEKGKFYYNQSVALSNNRLVLITHDAQKLWTRVKVVSTQGSDDSAVTKRLRGFYTLLAVFPDDSLLLTKQGMGDNLVKVSSDTLETLSSQFISDISSVGIIDNVSFFSITREGEGLYFTRYLWDGSSFQAYVEKTPLSLRPQAAKSIGQIKKMGGNRYAFLMKGYHNEEFKILLLDVDANTYDFKEVGVLEPTAYWYASGQMAVLPNGQLLTYYHYHDKLQLWDTTTLRCVKAWSWACIEKPKDFPKDCLTIEPFPDAIHLLLYADRRAYIFNTTNWILRAIKLKDRLEMNWAHNVLPNGELLTFAGKKPSSLAVFCNQLLYFTPQGPFLSTPRKHIKISSLDTQEMMDYRRKKEADFRLRLCLYQELFSIYGIPKDIVTILCFYAIVSCDKGQANHDDYDPIDQSSCLVM